MSVRHEFKPATAIPIPGGLPQREGAIRTDGGTGARRAHASTGSVAEQNLDQSAPARPIVTASPDSYGFEGPPEAAEAADSVCVGTAGAWLVAVLALGMPVFWIAFAASLVLGNSLLSALLTGWSIGMLAALAIPVCALLRPSSEAKARSGDAWRVARPQHPRHLR